MKKKILFVSTRNPYSGRYSGDVIRSLKILNFLEKKFDLDILCLKKKGTKILKKNVITFNNPQFFEKIFNCFLSLLKLEPVQFGIFFSRGMSQYIKENSDNYDYIFFYHLRSSQYLPKRFFGNTILEMGDLYSENYFQTFKYLSPLNPFKYIYFIESFLVKKAEKKIFSNFSRTILFSKNEIKKINRGYKNKIFRIDESVENINKKFSFSKFNNRILFVGNLNYLPNLLACKDFINNVLPKLRKQIPQVKFSIIGNISDLDKSIFTKKSNVEILGPKKNLSNYVKNSFCGLANLQIATGIQGKVLTYMSYGLPVVCSKRVAQNFGNNVLEYKKNSDLIEKLISLKKDKIISNNLSKKSIKFSKSLLWKKVKLKYLKLFKF